jgi:ergothioneine biosynthesis protein EgtB
MAAPQPVLVLPEARTAEALAGRYSHVRRVSLEICEPLETEDYVVQSMPDASPAKWHLAHTSWFFEQFLLKPLLTGYRAFDPDFEYLFNSYYQTVGRMHDRPQRGLLTRPTVKEVVRYREHVDEHMQKLLRVRSEDEKLQSITTLGLNHEQQHQELMFTDIMHLFSRNPLLPAYKQGGDEPSDTAAPMHYISFDGGIHEIGASGKHFCFDNELPRHRTLVEPYALADRLATNGEYLEFIRDGGYRRPEFWLSDGWSTVQREGWTRPIYLIESLDR